jgi:hypothetical protein
VPAPRRFRSSPVAATLVVIVVLPAVILAWYFFIAAPDPSPYVADIDALPVPTGWEVVHTQALRSVLGSRADRYWLVDGEPQAIAPVVQHVLRSAGLEIYVPDYARDGCDTPSLAASAAGCAVTRTGTCQEIGPGGPVRCGFLAFRWLSLDPPLLERLGVYISPRGGSVDVGVGDEHRLIDTSNRVLVRMSVDRTTARYFWALPTPRAP